jgi:DNA-binding NtrC family response regulator
MKIHRSQALPPEILLGNCPEIDQIRRALSMIGKSNQNVMVVGEPGTEKAQIARAICEHSQVAERCQIESEASKLNAAFDFEISAQIQRAEPDVESLSAIQGVLIIENVDQLTADAQKKLLVLARRGYFTLLGQKKPIATDFRIICTTSTKINNDAMQSGLDSELFLALSELTLKLPSLRDRRQDIPVLFEHYLKNVCEELVRPVPPINFEIFNQMLKYDWPGNVKDLENVVRSLVLSSPGGELLPQALPFFNDRQQFGKLELQSLGAAVAQLEKELIERALRKFAGNQSRAAQVLSISEPNLRFKMKKLGIRKQDFIYGT